MNPLSQWLDAIGLERYLSTFESSGIDLRTLPLLKEEDLAELGVLLGHRKLILHALAAGGPALPIASAHPAGRRQLTVMFCDLVGSTELSQRLDQEVLRDLMGNYQHACRLAVARYGGHVAQYLGDGLVVYFGFPLAHEDDAERAGRTALEIIRDLQELPEAPKLQVRIGIATGAVVVGHGGPAATLPSTAVGETPNLAARLQALAGPQEIVVSEATQRLLGDGFDVEDLGEHHLKGIVRPVRAWRLRDIARSDSRFTAVHPGRLTPIVGRSQEISELLSRWKRVVKNEGQVVVLIGEPGIGKSRIIEELRSHVASTPHVRMQYQCSPYHESSAFYPIVEALQRAAAFERDEAADEKLDKLEAMLALSAEELQTVAPLFATLLSLPTDRYLPRMLSPQKLKQLTMAALVEQVHRAAQTRPALLIVEDAHWIDPSTLETLTLVVERIRESAILLLVTGRPEFVPPWATQGHVTSINIGRLSRQQSAHMFAGIAEHQSLSPELEAQILDRADGVPLFVEELTRNVLEGGEVCDVDRQVELVNSLVDLTIPSALQGALMARIDRLGSAKEVAQIGACIGREFSPSLLLATELVPEVRLRIELASLQASGLIHRREGIDEERYVFKHALVRDAAYESVLKSRRKLTHERISKAIEQRFPEIAKDRPEVLALHLTRAGLIDKAVAQWITAAWLAHNTSKFREAVAQANSGLALLDAVTTDLRADLECLLLTVAAVCHFAMSGYASPRAADLLLRAEMLLEQVKDRSIAIRGIAPMAARAYVAAELPKALALAKRCLTWADQTDDIVLRIVAYASLAPTLCQSGELEQSRRQLQVVLDCYDIDQRWSYIRANDAKVLACSWLALIYVTVGKFRQVRELVQLAVDHARAIAHPFSLSLALGQGAMRLADLGDSEAALQMSAQCIALCDAQSLPFWKSYAMAAEGAALMKLGRFLEAEERLAAAIGHFAATGSLVDTAYAHSWRAVVLCRLGRCKEARTEAGDCWRRCIQSGERLLLARVAHACGLVEVLDPQSARGEAERWLGTAIEESRLLGERSTELRAATDLAEIWKQHGKHGEADELLAPLLVSFSEAESEADVRRAKVLLGHC